MIESRSNFTRRTGQAWSRLPASVRLGSTILAIVGSCLVAVATLDRPPSVPAVANAAVGAAPVRDPSVPDAGQALSADEQQQAWIPTF